MRIASYFQRRPGPGRPLRVALAVCAWGATLSFGCFFELGELVLPSAAGAGGGDAGIGIGGMASGGNGGAGAGGGGAGGVECGLGSKDCGAGCVPVHPDNGCSDPSCSPCAAVANATLSCNTDSGACQVDACAPGFADCDGDTATYTGAAGGNGCEYSFGPAGEVREPPAVLEVPRADIEIGDQGRDDWAGVPAYPLLATCNNCVDDALPEVTAQNEVPSRRDLDAYFRVAWDNDFFYVMGDVFDRELFRDGDVLARTDGRCQGGALCEDAFTVFIDGHNNRSVQSGYSNDDLRVFLALGSTSPFRVSNRQPGPGEVDMKVSPHELACYRIEAQFAWSHVVVPDGQAPEGQFPPQPGVEYGFDISVNDWDLSASNATPQRESQLFWVSPGDQYQRLTSGFGTMRLVEVASPPAAPE